MMFSIATGLAVEIVVGYLIGAGQLPDIDAARAVLITSNAQLLTFGTDLLRAQGCTQVQVTPLRLPAGFAWRKANVRQQFLRARLEAVDGRLEVRLFPRQGSAMLTSAIWADGLAIVECQRTLAEGELVQYLPFSELLG